MAAKGIAVQVDGALPPALAAEWRSVEADCPSLSFFQSWTWIGCLAEERFRDPVLLRLRQAGRTLGLALFNRRRGRLFLAETGEPASDAPFIEENGPLVAADAPPSACASLLRAAWGVSGTHRLVLSGVPETVAAAARGVALRRRARPAPWLDLDQVRAARQGVPDSFSANTRQQLRRALRRYEGSGQLVMERAEKPGEAETFLAELITLHQADWQARGRMGAFADPFMRRFHAELIRRALPRDEVDLLRVRAGPRVLGYLYNFRHRGRVYAYQSGFDRAAAGPHEKPGLVCHLLAIEQALTRGDRAYDFMAGEDRYKRSLSNASRPLLWLELIQPWSPLRLLAAVRRLLRN
jgi:CelD/BcsL family acetyltransferase involved in cellulose biosynthesis